MEGIAELGRGLCRSSSAPCRGGRQEHALVQLLDEERHAVVLFRTDESYDPAGRTRPATTHPHASPRPRRCERSDGDLQQMRMRRPRRLEARPVRRDHEHGSRLDRLIRLPSSSRLEGSIQCRSSTTNTTGRSRARARTTPRGPESLAALRLGAQLERRVALGERQREQVREERNRLRRAAGRRQPERARAGQCASSAEAATERPSSARSRSTTGCRRCSGDRDARHSNQVPARPESLPQRVQQARLPDTGLASDQRYAPVALADDREASRSLRRSDPSQRAGSDPWRHPDRCARGLRSVRSLDAPELVRATPGSARGPISLVLNSPAPDEAFGADHDGVGLGDRLQPLGEIHGVPESKSRS